MQIIDCAIRCPCGKVSFFVHMTNFIAVFAPAFFDIGVVNAEPAEICGFTPVITVGIGCPFVGVEAVKEVAVLHFPHVTSDVEFAKKSGVVTSLTKKVGKENFGWW